LVPAATPESATIASKAFSRLNPEKSGSFSFRSIPPAKRGIRTVIDSMRGV
jgi:hypothetical protein